MGIKKNQLRSWVTMGVRFYIGVYFLCRLQNGLPAAAIGRHSYNIDFINKKVCVELIRFHG